MDKNNLKSMPKSWQIIREIFLGKEPLDKEPQNSSDKNQVEKNG